jgi:hypothetical protein
VSPSEHPVPWPSIMHVCLSFVFFCISLHP